MPDTAEQAGAAIEEMTDAAWVLSALASVLTRGVEGPFPADDPAAAVLESRGLLAATGAGLVPVPALSHALGDRPRAFGDRIRSTLGQAAAVAFRDGAIRDGAIRDGAIRDGGWGALADEILLAHGRASAIAGPALAGLVIPVLDGLAGRFAAGGMFLDVGTGVAELACAFCEAVPGAHVVGIDPLPRAIELAATTVARHGLAGRVELRCQGVEDLTDEAAFDLARIPLRFIPYAAVREGLRRVLRALRPGGWVLLEQPVSRAGGDEIARWQVRLTGGTLLGEGERCQLLEQAGFPSPAPLSLPPWAPQVLAARRPD